MSNIIINLIKLRGLWLLKAIWRVKIGILVTIIWLFFIYISWITYTRLVVFFIFLGYIFFYKIGRNLVSKQFLVIKNIRVKQLLLYIYLLLNPVLLLLCIIEEHIIYKLLVKYHNKFIQILVFIFYLLIMNPVKIILSKYYWMLYRWNSYNFIELTLIRMMSLILNIVFISSILAFILYHLNLSIILLGYIYLVIINILNEIFKVLYKKYIWYFKWATIFPVCTLDLLRCRINVSLYGQLLINNNIENLYMHYNAYTKFKLDHIMTSYTWERITTMHIMHIKPNYWVTHKIYYNLGSALKELADYFVFKQKYFDKIDKFGNNALLEDDTYIGKSEFFQKIWKDLDLVKIKAYYEYLHKVVLVLLFFTWDLDTYLGIEIKCNEELNIYWNIQLLFIGDARGFTYFGTHKYHDEASYYELIKNKPRQTYFDLIYKLNKYNIFNYVVIGTHDYDNMEFQKKYHEVFNRDCCQILNDLMLEYGFIYDNDFSKLIEHLYKEWVLLDSIDKEAYYMSKLLELECEYKNLECLFLNKNDTK